MQPSIETVLRESCTFPRYFDASAMCRDLQNHAPLDDIVRDSGYTTQMSWAKAMSKYLPNKLAGMSVKDYILFLLKDVPVEKKESRKFGFRDKTFESFE
jgi:hypothetical protein